MLTDCFGHVLNVIRTIQYKDYIDIIIVAYLIYSVLHFIKQTRAIHLLRGLGILLVLIILAQALKLSAVCYLMTNVLQLSRWNLCILLKKLSLFPFRCYLTLHMLLKTILSLLQVNIKQTYQPLIISICPSRFPLPWRAQTEGNSASHLTQTKLWWL